MLSRPASRPQTPTRSDRERRRYERALRKATAQLHHARRRGPARAHAIASIDIVLILRRAERRRAAEEDSRRLRSARRRAPGAAGRFPLGRQAVAAAAGWGSLLVVVGSVASLWVIG